MQSGAVYQAYQVLFHYQKGNSKFGKTNRGNGEEWASPMEFNSSHHEYASKTFLGSNIGAEGSSNSDPSDLDQALNIRFICKWGIIELITTRSGLQILLH